MKIIPAGHILEITSWENDGDNYRTKVISPIALNTAMAYIEICKLFDSKHTHELGNYGNAAWTEEVDADLTTKVSAILKKANLPFDELDCEDLVYDLIGNWCDGEYYRVFEEAKLFYNPEEIRIQEIDVA